MRLLLCLLLLTACGSKGPAPAATTPAPHTVATSEDSAPAQGHRHGYASSRDQAQDRELERLREEIAILREQVESNAARKPAPARPVRQKPDPDKRYHIGVAGAAWEGDRDALVTIVKGYEYACRFCERTRPTVKTLLNDYRGDIKVVYRNFVVHASQATEPARAACAANLQGRFLALNELLWDEAYHKSKYDQKHIESLARKAGLKMQRFRSDRDGACVGIVKQDQEDLRAIGQTGTPTFWINGRYLSGARPVDQFKVLIDDELAKAREALRKNSSLTPANYYDKEILPSAKRKL